MALIKNIVAREILDSRGNPSVEVDVYFSDNSFGRASVPSGASTGEREAVELRDTDSRRYFGKGVQHAVRNIHELIAPALIGQEVSDQKHIDAKLIALDGTPNKSKLGANAILGVSMACAKAAAAAAGRPFYAHLGDGVTLPVPMMNVINGGAHADNGLDIQEFMIVPYQAPRFSEALRIGVEIFMTLKALLKKRGLSTAVGDEGGFAPHITTTHEVLTILCEAIEKAGYRVGEDVGLALDVAASEFYDKGRGKYELRGQGFLSSSDMTQFYKELTTQFPIVSIEDGFDQNDWQGFSACTKELGNKIQIVGDDLFVTNEAILKKAVDANIANAILIKPNQVGTLSETLNTIRLAQRSKYGVILSHRSGETEDTSIADIAVATNAGQIKTGSLSRTDRLSKYNQLLRIEEELGERAEFLGKKLFHKNGR